MPQDAAHEQETLLGTRVRVPQSVVFRSFPTETVVLNLQTGKYHGLNPTAGRMLEELAKAASVREAAAVVAKEYDCPPATIESDMSNLCQTLLDRGLIETDGAGAD
jgi:hypothetical protein